MDSASPPPLRRRALRFALIALSVLLLVTGLLVLIAFEKSSAPVVWLTPTEAANYFKPHQPGPLTVVKQKFADLMISLSPRFNKTPPEIETTATICSTSPQQPLQSGLGPPLSTNSAGAAAWIVKSSQLETLYASLIRNGSVTVENTSLVTTESGREVQTGTECCGIVMPNPPPRFFFEIDLLPSESSGSIKLTTVSLSSGFDNSGLNKQTPPFATNFSVACTVRVPDGGSLVLHYRDDNYNHGTNYWLILSPTLVDSQGRPIRQ